MRIRKPIWLMAACSLILSSNCKDEVLVGKKPIINVVPTIPATSQGSVDLENQLIHLGQVSIHNSAVARFSISNPSGQQLTISAVEITSVKGTGTFEIIGFPQEVAPDMDRNGDVFIDVSYQPKKVWQDANGNSQVDVEEMDQAVITVTSNAQTATTELAVDGWGYMPGAPEIQVCWGEGVDKFCGPNPDTDCNNGVCTLSQAFDFGNVALSSSMRKVLTIVNKARCNAPEGGSLCEHSDICKLVLQPNDERYNLGMGFEPGTNEAGHFSPVGSIATPVDIMQEQYAENCSGDSFIALRIDYQAPAQQVEDEAVFIVESSDPDMGVIRVPLKATAINAPVAVCKLRVPGPGNPGSLADEIEPLDSVYLDAGDSYDPQAPNDPLRIKTYQWEVINYPQGSNPNDFKPNQNDPYYDFWLPLAGSYQVKLTVTNQDGIASVESADSICTFQAVPSSFLHAELTWDDPNNDQDLHVLYLNESDKLCGVPYDCYFDNKKPVWFSTHGEGEGPNPRLDRDDTNGKGPENVNIDRPNPNTKYRIFTHYFTDNSGTFASTRNTLRVYLNGLPIANYSRLLYRNNVWAAVDVVWVSEQESYVTPLTGDVANEIGWLCSMDGCATPTSCLP